MTLGILVTVIFLVMAVLMMTKKMPALVALPLMSVLIGAVAGLPLNGPQGILSFVLADGSTKLAGTYIAILLACWLSQILYRTGVTDTIIKKAAELGGDKPFVISLLLCAATAFLFTTLYGTGAVVMVGSVVLPVMLSVGVPGIIASNAFLIAYAAGCTLNPASIAAITNITGVAASDITFAAIFLTVVGALFTVGYLAWGFKKNGLKFAFAARIEPEHDEEFGGQEGRPQVTGFRGFMATMTPLVIVILMLVFNWNVVALLMFGIAWAIVFTFKGNWSNYMNMVVQSCYEGFKEGAPGAALMIGIGMLLNAITAPITQAAINPFMVAITPTTAAGLVAFVCILAPLGLYRGPFNLMGLGAGLVASMLAVGVLPVAALSAVFYAAHRWPSRACPTSTQVVWAANYVGLDPVTVTNQVLLANWVLTAASTIVLTLVYF